MFSDGPTLELLLQRLSDCPAEFLETCTTDGGGEQVAAIIADHLRELGIATEATPSLKGLESRPKNLAEAVRYWGLLSVATWLVHDPWFLSRPELAKCTLPWLLSDELQQLAALARPDQFIADPDRREELARLCLRAHGAKPLGEADAHAIDRLHTLDSVERQKILQATAAAERRAREVREAMARKQALESASRYGE